MKTFAWALIMIAVDVPGSIHHVPFQTQALCERAKTRILSDWREQAGFKKPPAMYCVQNALVDAAEILPEIQHKPRRPG